MINNNNNNNDNNIPGRRSEALRDPVHDVA